MGKLEKTDKTGKTVEAWWALLLAEGSLGQSILRWVWPVIGGAVGIWVASATDWIASYGVAGWAATIVVGVLAAIWGLAGFEHIRTKRWLREQSTEEHSKGSEDSALVSLIDTRFEELLATRLRAEFISNRQHHAYDERLTELGDKVATAKQRADASMTTALKLNEQKDARIAEIASGCADLERKFQDWSSRHSHSNRQRFKNIDGGFRAIGDREKLQVLATAIRKKAEWLLRSTHGEKVDNWGMWDMRHSDWQIALHEYGVIASHYLDDLPKLIGDVPARKIQGEWPEDKELFPNDDAMIAHRTTAVMMRNFEKQHERLMKCVESFAFQSPSMKGIEEG